MRIVLLTVGLLAFGSAAQAQQVAQVTTVASVRVPDFLVVKPGTVSERTLENGKHQRRVTLYVTANRAWTLSIARACESNCTEAQYRVSAPAGKAGTALPVVVEFTWDSDEPAPPTGEFHYLLLGT
jgi:hypothetical protein